MVQRCAGGCSEGLRPSPPARTGTEPLGDSFSARRQLRRRGTEPCSRGGHRTVSPRARGTGRSPALVPLSVCRAKRRVTLSLLPFLLASDVAPGPICTRGRHELSAAHVFQAPRSGSWRRSHLPKVKRGAGGIWRRSHLPKVKPGQVGSECKPVGFGANGRRPLRVPLQLGLHPRAPSSRLCHPRASVCRSAARDGPRPAHPTALRGAPGPAPETAPGTALCWARRGRTCTHRAYSEPGGPGRAGTPTFSHPPS